MCELYGGWRFVCASCGTKFPPNDAFKHTKGCCEEPDYELHTLDHQCEACKIDSDEIVEENNSVGGSAPPSKA